MTRPIATTTIPDFSLVIVLAAVEDSHSAGRFLARWFDASERFEQIGAASDLASIATALSERRLAAMLTSDASLAAEAARLAKQSHAPVIVLRFGDGPRSSSGDAIDLDPAAPPRLVRRPLQCDRRGDSGPFDVIGDVHGCFDELVALLEALGWRVGRYRRGETRLKAEPPAGRRALFVGDLTDRGPRNVDTLRLVMGLVDARVAEAVCGNHDHKLRRMLSGSNVTRNHGLAETEAELLDCSEAFRGRVERFLEELPSHLWLDGGRLVVAHAGLKAPMHGRDSRRLRDFALFGDVSGERDAYGLPVRRDWAARYSGDAAVIYGHTPTLNTVWRNNTICVDSGCCFGGRLTALRWPERELVSVDAAEEYSKPIKPLDGA